MINTPTLRKKFRSEREMKELCGCQICQEKAEAKHWFSACCVLAFLIAVIAIYVVGMFVDIALADDFEKMKAEVAEGIKGTDATLKEYVVPKFSEADVKRIEKARKELSK